MFHLKFLARLFAAVLALVMCHQAFADEGRRIGLGAASCPTVIQATASGTEQGKEQSKMFFVSWTQGFITGMNIAQERLHPELGHNLMPENEVLWAQLVDWCSTHPSGSLMAASIDVFNKLPKAK